MGAPRRSRGRGPQLRGWRIVQIREAILSVFGLSSQAYSLTQLRYDLRKIKAHACWSVPADPTATGHPQRHPGGGPLRFSSTSASVALSPTACSTAAHSQPRNRRRNRNGLTPKLTGPQVGDSRACIRGLARYGAAWSACALLRRKPAPDR